MNPPHLRAAEVRDAVVLAELSGQLGYPTSLEDLLARLPLLLRRTDHLVLVAEREGAVTGWIHATEVLSMESPPFVAIVGLVVAQEARGSGLGRALVEAVSRWAASRGFHELRVRTNVVRQEAHGFYCRLGFSAAKTQTVFVMALRAEGPGPDGKGPW